jgi:hypothetical protein
MTPEEQRALLVAYKKCFATDDGVVVLADLARFCMERRSTYVRGNDALQTAFNEGSRTVILEIRKKLEADLEHPPPMRTISEEEQ